MLLEIDELTKELIFSPDGNDNRNNSSNKFHSRLIIPSRLILPPVY